MNAREASRQRFLDPAFDKHRQRGLRKSLETRTNGPRCGAKSRTTGEPCRQPVKEEGKRCRYHGGATPKGENWHRRLWNGSKTPRRVQGKLKALDLRDRQAEERRAAMTPEERAQHEERRKPKRPGTPGQRERAARQRKAAKEMREMLAEKQEREASPEAQRLAAEIERLEVQAAAHPRIDLNDPDNLPEIFQ